MSGAVVLYKKSACQTLEGFIFETDKLRGGGQLHPAQSERKNCAFFAKRLAVWFETRSTSNGKFSKN